MAASLPGVPTPTASLKPKLWSVIEEGYRWPQFKADALAGLTVAIVALPLAMALAIASGSTPEKGLLTAVFAGFLISALSGSRHQVGGPTGAFVVVIFNIIAEFGVDGLALATLMAGLILMAAGWLKLGSLIRYIPEPVIAGFTAGIAIILFSSQFGEMLGLELGKLPGDIIGKWIAYGGALDSFSVAAFALALMTMAIIIGCRRYVPKAPGFLIAIVAAGLLTWGFGLPVETIGTRFGSVPATLPVPSIPAFDGGRLLALMPSALTIAFLAGIESLLCAVVIDGLTGRRHRPNAELVAQGAANMVSGLLGLLPATGAIARTVTNVRAGAQTPMAGIFHALFVLAFLFFLGPLAVYVPMASLAGVLTIVAWNMADPGKFVHLLRAPRGDRVIFITTLVLTVAVDLTVAIEVGVVMAAIMFTHRMAELTVIGGDGQPQPLSTQSGGPRPWPGDPELPEDVAVYRLRGPLFFGAAGRLAEVLDNMGIPPRVFLLKLADVPMIDVTGAFALREFVERADGRGIPVIAVGLQPQPKMVLAPLAKEGPLAHLHQVEDMTAAVALIGQLLPAKAD
jgi:sulfate permease, SulP family